MDTWSYDVASDLVKNKSDKKFLSDIGGRKHIQRHREQDAVLCAAGRDARGLARGGDEQVR